MKLTPLVNQIRDRCPTFGGRVAGGLDWDPAMAASAKMALPAAYVVMTGDEAAPSQADNVVQQDIADEFDVCVVLDQEDEAGVIAADAVHDIRAQLWRALVGFRPSPELEPIQYDGGGLLLINRARVVYRFGFSSAFQLGRNDGADPAETWQEWELDGLLPLEGLDIALDAVDPMADKNLQYPGPDGRIEAGITLNLPEETP
ncbi:hypothetical protein GPA19_08000 [Azoarcus indigens]|uniref:Uncharacterized protein n=1 Tax=Azoarcus indigens TaxID=29545 RepID=A0A4R6DZR6_9RHOO|nr:hypothetical protein [Azoarcus indigens]NMG64886.1 hypothetical protein [Azoarcus indigens]TDN50424.1 hypothetical protein C7389_109118 [Azoarcus indigens]